MIRDYPRTATQTATADRHADKRRGGPPSEHDLHRIEAAEAKRARRQREAD